MSRNGPLAPPRSVLVLGGARSGKSRFAQTLAEGSGRAPTLIATATAGDEEMRARIERHRADRGNAWSTIEEPIALAKALARATGPRRVVVVDCLTLWLANILHAGGDADAAANELVAVVAELSGPAIFVANEVGWGIVPENAVARRFRDAQGRLNQVMAAACDNLVLVTAGVPRVLKPTADPAIRL
ncbi:MAG: bifunctional adenosylcobinamide kinase/adenosylcobinamide-phosphate guanylyltransferase [Methylobacteriaceae bacterium]|nr:bifunctional adenosylcobinamide kinase/adenosylcobinamide-phosphate guanylyltransferase [Methylobacteriaceae bacterium]